MDNLDTVDDIERGDLSEVRRPRAGQAPRHRDGRPDRLGGGRGGPPAGL